MPKGTATRADFFVDSDQNHELIEKHRTIRLKGTELSELCMHTKIVDETLLVG